MHTDIYEKLAKHLDELPAGFPRTDNGAEMRILQRLFTPEEAELALHVSLIEERARVIARRAGKPLAETSRLLEEMETKGLVFAYRRRGREPRYQAVGYIIGLLEFQVNRLDGDLVRDIEDYTPQWFNLETWRKAPQLRTIPVGKSITFENKILPYEQADEIVRKEDTFAVASCICRREQEIEGHRCDKPIETCLLLGDAAKYYIRNELGRPAGREEVLDILRLANKTGLVLQPGNAKKPSNICTCCGCCCGVLRNIKHHPKPATIVATPCVVNFDASLCNSCTICETRSQMDAIQIEEGRVTVEKDRCIGCGLCVSTCAENALTLVRKPKKEQSPVPRNVVDTNIRLGRARGTLSIGKMVRMFVKSRIDRLLSSRRED